jgi:hypothetical protein
MKKLYGCGSGTLTVNIKLQKLVLRFKRFLLQQKKFAKLLL